jgi:hypothetical protein
MHAVSELEWHDVRLRPVESLLEDLPTDLEHVIRVGTIDVLSATSLTDMSEPRPEPAPAELLERFDFAVVRIPLSIHPRSGLQVRFVEVGCSLVSPAGQADCYSLAPERIEHEFKAKSVAKLSAKLQLVTAEAGYDAEYVVYQPSLIAYGLGQSNPSWEFRPIRGLELRGIQLLHLLARVQKGAALTGTISIRADIVMRRLLFNVIAVDESDRREVGRFGWPP